MEATKPRLGRGLNALIGDMISTPNGPAEGPPPGTIEVEKIARNPYQPRKQFDSDEHNSLTQSVRTHGVLQPIVVREVDGNFQLIAGERRLRAAQAAGLAEVPVHIVRFDDQQVFEAALVENIQRSDLNAIEKAQGFRDYLDRFGMTQEQLGTKLGLDRTTISNLLGLLNLPTEVQDAVRLGQITLGHAKVLKGVPEADRQIALCKETLLRNYSVHALELLVKQRRQEAAGATPAPATERPEPVEKTAHVKSVEVDLGRRLSTKVEIKLRAKDRGQIVIGFDNTDDFERIVKAVQV